MFDSVIKLFKFLIHPVSSRHGMILPGVAPSDFILVPRVSGVRNWSFFGMNVWMPFGLFFLETFQSIRIASVNVGQNVLKSVVPDVVSN